MAVQCSADNFVVNQTLVLRINICGKNRQLLIAAKRYTREKKQETTERHLDVAKTRSAERYNYSNDHSINYTKAARHARVSPQVNYLKCICPQWTKVEQNDFNRGFKTNGSKLPSDEKTI